MFVAHPAQMCHEALTQHCCSGDGRDVSPNSATCFTARGRAVEFLLVLNVAHEGGSSGKCGMS